MNSENHQPHTPESSELPSVQFTLDESFALIDFNGDVDNFCCEGGVSFISSAESSKLVAIDKDGNIDVDFGKTADLASGVSLGKCFLERAGLNVGRYQTHIAPGRIVSNDTLSMTKLVDSELRSLLVDLLGGSRKDMDKLAFPRPAGASSFSLSKTGEYLMISFDGGLVAAYKMYDSGGRKQPPKNWKLIRNYVPEYYKGTFNDDFDSIGDELTLLKENEVISLRYIGEHFVVVGKDSLQVVNGDTKEILCEDNTSFIADNIVTDPNNDDVMYYCSGKSPGVLYQLTLSEDQTDVEIKSQNIPQQFRSVKGLSMDPSGQFFVFVEATEDRLVILDRLALEEVASKEDVAHFHFDPQGRIRMIDKQGKLAAFHTNLSEIGENLEAIKLTEGLSVLEDVDLWENGPSQEDSEPIAENIRTKLEGLKAKYDLQFETPLAEAKDDAGLEQIQRAATKLRAEIKNSSKIKKEHVDYIMSDIEAQIAQKEKEFSAERNQRHEKEASIIISEVRRLLEGTLSANKIATLRTGKISKLQSFTGLPELVQDEITQTLERFVDVEADFYKEESEAIETEVQGIITTVESEISDLKSHAAFDAWYDGARSGHLMSLTAHYQACPPSVVETRKKIHEAQKRVNSLADTTDKKFREEYAHIREKVSEQSDVLQESVKEEIDRFMDRTKSRGFNSRAEAERFVQNNETKKFIKGQIDLIRESNEDLADQLESEFQIAIATTLHEVDLMNQGDIAEDGRPMVKFGSISFPKFEAKVAAKEASKAQIDFIDTERSGGDVYGDIGVTIQTGSHTKKLRLWSGKTSENLYRDGLREFKGTDLPPSYCSKEDFKNFYKKLRVWMQPHSPLKLEHDQRRQALKDLYQQRHASVKSDDMSVAKRGPEDAQWQVSYRALLEEYTKFYGDHDIVLLQQAERVLDAPDPEYENGAGYIPKMSPNWVVGPEEEAYLEDIAQYFKMQGDLQEGMLNLKGHTGTGKDVLLAIFCSKERGVGRPLFEFDCSKWDTEKSLSETVELSAEGGQTETVLVPSSILRGIQTPGAVVYFNEFNALTEPAQKFLNALFDEKRKLTLKTRSGETIKADSSVLFACSMNPGYSGTNQINPDMRSRVTDLEIGYPSLMKQDENGNATSEYSVSEALKIARSVKSLKDTTYDPDLDRNEFSGIWDAQINQSGTLNQSLSPQQSFDLDVVLGLVQFSHRLREEFVKNQTKGSTRRGKGKRYNISQPITLRETRRCAYLLSHMSEEERVSTTPEKCAKKLISAMYFSKIDDPGEREDLEKFLATETTKKRIA